METKIFLCIFFLFCSWNLVDISCEEVIAIFAPRTVFKTHKYNVFIQTKEIDQKIELALQFRQYNRTYALEANNTYSLQYPTNVTNSVKKLNFTATLYREKKQGSDIVQQCSTQNLEVKVDRPIFYTFIQTDKPIYNPREDVKFRIIVVDKDLKPRIMNNINIEIVDPLNRTIATFTDLSDGKNLGVYVEKFTISKNPLFGSWKIKVTVDKLKSLSATKSFSVHKFELPLFGVNIETSAKDYLPESRVEIKFSAGYAFGDHVAGDAELVIQNIEDDQIYYAKQFKNVDSIEKIIINMKKDFNTQIHSRVVLRAMLTFTEFESGLTYNKSTEFTVHADSSVKITPVHPKKFTPGFPFDFKVFVQNWKNETYNSYDEVEMDYIFKLTDGTRKKVTFYPLLNNGTAEQYTMVPEDAIEFDIQCRFLNSRVYRVKVGMAKFDHESKKLEIAYYPNSPRFGSTLDVHVRSEHFLDNIIVAIMTKYGNIDTRMINCQNKIVCSFEVEIVEEMIPRFTIEVFNVRYIDTVDYGTVEISTKNIGENYLKMDKLSNAVKSKSSITMSFNTTENSRIFLLAVDKRVTFLGNSNDIKRDDIMHKIGHIDTKHAVLIDDMESWQPCTPEELQRIENGRRAIVAHSRRSYDDDDDEDDDEFDSSEFPSDDETGTEEKEVEELNVDELRENFPHTWLFETIETNSTVTNKTYKVPDSMTSWHISAFSVHDQKGLGIMRPRELLVKNDFFIKFSLPYSLKYKEILRIDVMVFNRNKFNSRKMNVKVKMLNQRNDFIKPFEFVEYDNCTPTFNTNRNMIQETEVPSSGSKKVSFYIRSSPNDNDFTKEKYINIIVLADATDEKGNTYKDSVRKSLRIAYFGVKLLDVDSVGYTLSGNRVSTVYQTNSSDTYTNSYCIVSGDYLSEKISFDSEFEQHSSDLIDQKLSKLKWNTNLNQYLKTKNKTINLNNIKEEFQDILVMREIQKDNTTTSGLISLLVDALASAMNENLIPELPDIIEKELDILKTHQQESGEFSNFGSIPEYNKNSSDYNHTKIYFETAYVLIAFLKSDRIVDQKYADVITKALNYLEENSKKFERSNEALSIAAYVFSLKSTVDNGYEIRTKSFLDNIENTLIDHSGKEMCIKLASTDDDCNLRQTAYTAMTYININYVQKALPLIYWLLKTYNFNLLNGDYYNAAVASEPIAKISNLLSTNATDITVLLKDEFNFEKSLKLVEGNSLDFHLINFPTHSKVLNSTFFGHGFVSITKVVERTLDFAIAIEPTFHINVSFTNNKAITKAGEIVFDVCARFISEEFNVNEISHVVWEIQMPSGYIFDEIIDLEWKKKNVVVLKEGRKKSYIVVHFVNFQGSHTYCIPIRAVKMFEIKNPQQSSVKIFSFIEKQQFGLEFYEIPSKDTC